MSDEIKGLLLGILQGLTEYLPVSSSGHIELGKYLLDFDIKDDLTFSVILHFGTVLSTLVVFRQDIAQLLRGLFQFRNNEEWQFSLKILVSMLPAAFVGLFFEKEIDLLFAGNITLVAMMLLVTGLLLFMADRSPKAGKPLTFFNAFAVGIAQAIAILPGISRSGATIASSIALGIDRAQAARFSFLMVVPLILGKVAKDLLSGEFSLADQAMMPLLLGFLASFAVGLLACSWMLNLVRRGKLVYFSLYCWLVGGGSLLWLYLK